MDVYYWYSTLTFNKYSPNGLWPSSESLVVDKSSRQKHFKTKFALKRRILSFSKVYTVSVLVEVLWRFSNKIYSVEYMWIAIFDVDIRSVCQGQPQTSKTESIAAVANDF